jgi:hypothetical protein
MDFKDDQTQRKSWITATKVAKRGICELNMQAMVAHESNTIPEQKRVHDFPGSA